MAPFNVDALAVVLAAVVLGTLALFTIGAVIALMLDSIKAKQEALARIEKLEKRSEQ